MTAVIEPDTRGVDALYGHVDATVPAVIWGQIVNELGPVPPVPQLDPFDNEPWRQLPLIEELAYLWVESPIAAIIADLAIVAHGAGPDLPEFIARQRWLAGIEVELARERQAQHGQVGAGDDAGAVGEAAAVVSAAALRGGEDLSGESEDGVAVVEGGQVAGDPHVGAAPQVPRRRRAGKAAKGRGGLDGGAASAEGPPATV